MGTSGKETAQRLLAILVIMAMLMVMGIPLTVIIFFATVVYFVWRAVQRSEQQDIRSIFDFYIAANEILRDEERRWYGFEIQHVIKRGIGILDAMPDAPPLVYFTLGVLHHRIDEHEAAVERLSYVLENERGNERHCFEPSSELSRYVQVLRRLEREPTEAPQTMAAIRSLDRTRRTRAAAMLEESRERLKASAAQASITNGATAHVGQHSKGNAAQNRNASVLNSVVGNRQPSPLQPSAPPPIAEVLRNVYEEEKKTA